MIRFCSRIIPVLVLCVALLSTGSCKKNTELPNVVLLVVDALRSDHLPLYGYPRDTAPFLTEIAGESLVCEWAFSVSSWTSPSMASMLTSLYPFQHGVLVGLRGLIFANRIDPDVKINRIPDAVTTLAEKLHARGYRTFGLSANLNISEQQGFNQGFDHFLTKKYQAGTAAHLFDIVMQWKQEMVSGPPYFLYIHFMDPHTPYRDHRDVDGDSNNDTPALDAYDREIQFWDGYLERLYHALSWGKNTLLVITADHGEARGEHGRHGHAKTLFREEIQVPLIVSFPGKITGRRVRFNATTLDIMPTITDLIGLPVDPLHEGISLVADGPEVSARRRERPIFGYLLRAIGQGDAVEWTSVIADAWHLVRRSDISRMMLFNMREDPREARNRAADHSALARRLYAMLYEFRRTCRRFEQQDIHLTLERHVLRELETLGYVN